jgi:hypothetical protein
MKHFNAEILLNLGTEKHQEYINASPFPHIVLDNLFDLDTLRKISYEFPKMQEKMQEQYNKQQEPQQNTTSSSTQTIPKEKKVVGDYIDYEELK